MIHEVPVKTYNARAKSHYYYYYYICICQYYSSKISQMILLLTVSCKTVVPKRKPYILIQLFICNCKHT